MNHYSKGYLAFANTNPTITGTNTGNLSFEYMIDTGAGFVGGYKALTGANLSSEVFTFNVGFNLRIRVTCTVAGDNQLQEIDIPLTTNSTVVYTNADIPVLTDTSQLDRIEARCNLIPALL